MNRLLIVACLILIAGLIWMDACLYFQIQRIGESDDGAGKHAKLNEDEGGGGVNKTHSFNYLMSKFSSFAFRGMSVKLMMTDPVDSYLLAPLAEILVEALNLKDNFKFITPNVISYAGVASALVAAKLVAHHESSTMQTLSYVMFQLRTWLDDLDGAVARSRLGIREHVSLQATSGYVVDGVCDAIGFVAYVIGCYALMRGALNCRRRQQFSDSRRQGYNLQSITEVKSSNSPSAYMALQDDCEDDERSQTKDDSSSCRHRNDENAARKVSDDDDDDDDDENDDEEILFNAPESERLFGNNSSSNQSEVNPSLSRSKIFLEKIRGTNSSYISYKYIKRKLSSKNHDNQDDQRRLTLVTVCFLLQLALSALFWNRYILVYRDLLESPSFSNPIQAKAKTKLLKSNILYVIIWFWRLTNGHSLMQLLIGSVLIGKLWQFLNLIKYIGFIEIILLAFVTELHTIDIRSYLEVD